MYAHIHYIVMCRSFSSHLQQYENVQDKITHLRLLQSHQRLSSPHVIRVKFLFLVGVNPPTPSKLPVLCTKYGIGYRYQPESVHIISYELKSTSIHLNVCRYTTHTCMYVRTYLVSLAGKRGFLACVVP